MTKIGEDRTERLHVVPAKLQVIVTVRPKYACRQCEQGVTQAPAPAHLIEGALPTEGMLAHVLVSKFADHLPLHRQAQIYARSGIGLHRSTLAGWVGKASFHLRPVFECLKAELKTSNTLGLDETTVRVLDPGRGKTKTGYLWTMARDERGWSGPDPPGVVYEYAPSRSGKHGEKLLEGFQGTVQVDGYSGHNRLARSDRPGGALTRAACWVHARRGLKEMFDSNGSPITKAGLKRIAQLYQIEAKIRGESPATRQLVRWTESAPLVNALGVWLDEQRSRVSPRSRLGEKLTYIANQWDGLLVFLYDGRVEMDSNFVENRIRPDQTHRTKTRCSPAMTKGAQRVGSYRHAHRDLQDERRRALCLAQKHAGEDRRRSPPSANPRTAALELRLGLKLNSRRAAPSQGGPYVPLTIMMDRLSFTASSTSPPGGHIEGMAEQGPRSRIVLHHPQHRRVGHPRHARDVHRRQGPATGAPARRVGRQRYRPLITHHRPQ